MFVTTSCGTGQQMTCSNCADLCAKLARIQYILDTKDDLYHVADLDQKIREVLGTEANNTTTTMQLD